MKTLGLLLLAVSALMVLHGEALALEVPEKYSTEISTVDFYPSGAKFTFAVEPQGSNGDFTAVIPGAFNPESIRLANPENVYGDIYAHKDCMDSRAA